MKATFRNRIKAIRRDKAAVLDYNQLVYGTTDKAEIAVLLNEPLSSAMCRYMNFRGIGTNELAALTGIAASTISRYRSGKRGIRREYLCAICMALRLLPCQQRHLFAITHLEMPDDKQLLDNREYIIRDFMDGCAYNDCFTLSLCNRTLRANGEKMLTSLISEQEGSE